MPGMWPGERKCQLLERAPVAAKGFVWYKIAYPLQERSKYMPSYVLLEQYTDQGIRNVKDTTKRAAAVRGEIAGKFGVKITDMVWTLGPFDVVVVAEAPNDETIANFALSVAKLGNVKIQTLRAFRAPEVDALLAKL